VRRLGDFDSSDFHGDVTRERDGVGLLEVYPLEYEGGQRGWQGAEDFVGTLQDLVAERTRGQAAVLAAVELWPQHLGYAFEGRTVFDLAVGEGEEDAVRERIRTEARGVEFVGARRLEGQTLSVPPRIQRDTIFAHSLRPDRVTRKHCHERPLADGDLGDDLVGHVEESFLVGSVLFGHRIQQLRETRLLSDPLALALEAVADGQCEHFLQ